MSLLHLPEVWVSAHGPAAAPSSGSHSGLAQPRPGKDYDSVGVTPPASACSHPVSWRQVDGIKHKDESEAIHHFFEAASIESVTVAFSCWYLHLVNADVNSCLASCRSPTTSRPLSPAVFNSCNEVITNPATHQSHCSPASPERVVSAYGFNLPTCFRTFELFLTLPQHLQCFLCFMSESNVNVSSLVCSCLL